MQLQHRWSHYFHSERSKSAILTALTDGRFQYLHDYLRRNWEYLRLSLWLTVWIFECYEGILPTCWKIQNQNPPARLLLKSVTDFKQTNKKSLHETNDNNFVKPLVGSHFSYTTTRDCMIVSPTPQRLFSQRSKSKRKRKIPESTWNTR